MKDPRVYLAHILECIDRIQLFVQGGRQIFFKDRMVQDAVIRNLEIIGEAAKRVSEEYRKANPNIPWRSMAALRNILIHQYEGVDLEKLWQIVEKELPPLKSALSAFLPPLSQLEAELAGEPPQEGEKKQDRPKS